MEEWFHAALAPTEITLAEVRAQRLFELHGAWGYRKANGESYTFVWDKKTHLWYRDDSADPGR